MQASARALGRIGTLEASKALETALPKTAEANRLAIYEGLFRCADVLAQAQGQRRGGSRGDRTSRCANRRPGAAPGSEAGVAWPSHLGVAIGRGLKDRIEALFRQSRENLP